MKSSDCENCDKREYCELDLRRCNCPHYVHEDEKQKYLHIEKKKA